MATAREFVGKVYETAYKKMNNWREISRLNGNKDATSQSLANVFNAVLKKRVTAEERLAIDRIEDLRNELKASSTEISIMDYGAGSPDLNLTTQEMNQGRPVIRTIGEVCQRASIQRNWAFLIFRLIREFRPSVCLELGTALGISAAYQAAALELNHHGQLVTLEGAESLASVAVKNWEGLGLGRVIVRVGRFQDTLHHVLAEHPHIDFAFIDGHHDEHATLAYFEQIRPFLSEKAVLVFDDISWSEGMGRAWNAILTDSRIRLSADLGKVGVCVAAGSGKKKSLKIAMDWDKSAYDQVFLIR